jgi:signal transduction histidine kinase
MTGVPDPRRPRHRSIRARIAIACAGLFLVLGGILIGATYGLVAHTEPHAFVPRGALIPGCLPARGARTLAQKRTCRQLVDNRRAAAIQQRDQDRREFLVYSLAGLGLATFLAAGLGWAVSGRVLRPLRAITEAARAASQENLDQRLALGGPPDELKELADTFDAMLARLDAAFASQRRFVANASHELRTPLTEMRALIDVSLAKPASAVPQLEATLAGVRAAVDKSEELIEALLTLARSDRGLGHTELVDLPTAVEDAVDQTGPAAAARQVRIDTALERAQVTGERVLLERLVSNLIDNAVRHNVPGGWVLVSTRYHEGRVELTVANSGDLIPADQVASLFEPFRRLSGRGATRSGTGLGLSIVVSVAKAHGGLTEAHARPAGGLEVQVKLPAQALQPPDNASLRQPGAAGEPLRLKAGTADEF